MKNSLKLGGFQKLSLLDYPGKIIAVLWTIGCNFRCSYCYNSNLVIPERVERLKDIPFENVLSYLKKRRNFLDCVVITGGEPTIHQELPRLIKKIKKLGYLIKLDTNGSNPSLIRKILQIKIVDYIAMDVKAPVEEEKYKIISGIDMKSIIDKINNSIDLLLKSSIDYEFRTTLIPTIHTDEDIEKIAKRLSNARLLTLQKFQSTSVLDHSLNKFHTQNDGEMERKTKAARRFTRNVEWR